MNSAAAEWNWAGNYRYGGRVVRPRTVGEAQDLIAGSPRVRALGSRHSFTDLPDSEGLLLDLSGLADEVEVDAARATARVTAWSKYGVVAEELERQGWALAGLASLPHISVAGAVATGTHGSGDKNQALSAAVGAIDYVGADGQVRRVARGDADFPGSVVALGVLGIAVAVELDLELTFEVRQDVLLNLPWSTVESSLDELMGAAYSVSLFTRFGPEGVHQAWFKSRELSVVPGDFGARVASEQTHMLADGDAAATTQQLGVAGPWLHRLPHFRMEFTPSNGAELQSEYLVPRSQALTAIDRLRSLGGVMAPLLQAAEFRTVAADDQWLSPASGRDVLGVHFTWRRDPDAVYALLPLIEDALLPLGARPHWGKCFVAGSAELAQLYDQLPAFRSLRDRVDPERKFGNAFLARVLGD
ncbi:D-arabinono-1,4-lactone oxidase [Branchiibius sp. NY16-3462-2]|uniref:D-arabinono-1,4-lactone oxidase n=1 Tax=Branchiibius sp. NY16-3462-2 TaxID=1807500 RepID=UPI000793F002|nr:D-arabinono-1,4-lactone oxidase [Branchiibius sp. NY16-3462-2]KYH45160.1 FAD-binding protein [Branchiibius sp. NY16-3462-2]